MLKDATNQVREESDNLYAVDKQVEEAIDLLGEWIQETNDFKLAQELAEAMEKERESQRRLEIIQGESAALKLAVEEKRRIKAEADAKTAREREDAEFAKRIAEEEEKFYYDAKRQYEEDEKLCKEMQDTVTPLRPTREEKEDDNEVHEDDNKAPSRRCFDSDNEDDCKADCKGDYDMDDTNAFDFVPNQTFQGTATTSYFDEKEIEEEYEPMPDTSKDRELAMSIARNEYRQDFQKLKQRQTLALYDASKSSKDEKLVCQLWDRANAEVDDVQGAVCLTILLPNVKKLKVNIESDGITVRVVAWRQILERRLATTDNSQYVAEFHLDGRNIRIAPKDISYDYKAETGILHVYIEEVCLDTAANKSSSSAAPAASSKDNSTLLPSNAAGNSEKQKRNVKQAIASEIKNSFFRIFNNKNRK